MKIISSNFKRIIGIVFYFFVLSYAYAKMDHTRLFADIQAFSGMFLFLGLLVFEKAYKEENDKKLLSLTITGVELIVLSMYSLSIVHITTFFKYDVIKYLELSAGVFSIYYVLKAIVMYTLDKKNSLKKLSDISEIVKEEPIKKEATKKNAKVH